ncbi:MAG: succinylglutamate desuccinylase/aspartoacylase family protein [Desulfuromonadaceae bacterium]|nr:succinylglutamate desuccinylase/aspartoacylase family protein [Desulfuromonadaceae bacterium]
MRKNKTFEFGGVKVEPGTCASVALNIARLYTHNDMTLPVQVVNGRHAGPVMFVSAAVHGDEINGVEIIRRLLQHKSLRDLRGTLLALPLLNPYGFIHRSRYLPDRRDLNRSFPGSSKGSLAGRLAYHFMRDVASRCDFGVDLHTGSNYRTNLAQVRADLSDPPTRELAMAFGAPLIVDSTLREGSLRAAVSALGKPVVVFEGGEALYFNESAIRTGLHGILRLMRHTEMLPLRKRTARFEPIVTNKSSWIRASMSGIFTCSVRLGTIVEKHAVLGTLSAPLGDEAEEVIAPFSGIVIALLNLPLAYEGDALLHLAVLAAEEAAAEETIDEYTSLLRADEFEIDVLGR